MHIHVSYLIVLLAAMANLIVAVVWYGAMFAKEWKILSGQPDFRPTIIKAVYAFIASVFMSFVLYQVIQFSNAYFHTGGHKGGLIGTAIGWIGFVVPISLTLKVFENRKWGLLVLDNAFWLLSLFLMSEIISLSLV